ncbi:restriction endonuclease [[Kitasatospora] papulosa]|uniref:nSTAND3 domain-containing NTPase n=1 Tax=[Kitasatospora] papulosa TaxID=1464011 RepID=UPI00381FD116
MPRIYTDLSPHDFEVLVRDLLQAKLGVRMETFPQGRDGGVDVRLHRGGREELIVQCKHSPGKTYAQIKSNLESEAKKIGDRFKCKYMLVTSASLTRRNKEEIAQLFSGVQLSPEDIYGVNDLDNLLQLHPEVETRNFKLWITSSAVLEFLMHSELHRRSENLVDSIVRRRKFYVHSEAFPASLEILDDHQVCIISGQPGIGKTTLAETLLVKLLADGWQVHVASEDISDIERIWNPAEKQAFLYDDFLGQTSLLDKLNKNEDSRIAQVIERVHRSQNKRLIMTTREYILQQAEQIHEPLHRLSALRDGKILLNLGHYTRHQRAQIFYNHMHFMNLGDAAVQSVINNKRYRAIVDHANFNPRIIELVTKNFKRSNQEGADFYEYLAGALHNPKDLWEQIFQNQLGEAERIILLILATVGEKIHLSDLHIALTEYEKANFGSARASLHDLKRALKKLEGTFVTLNSNARLSDATNGIHPDNPSTLVALANPSFIDYVRAYLASRPEEISQVSRGCAFFEQAETLANWELGVDPLLFMAANAFFGTSATGWKGTRIPQLAAGQQTLVMQALVRLMDANSCYWMRDHSSGHALIRQSFTDRERHLAILRLDNKHNRTLLRDEVLQIMAEALEARLSHEISEMSVVPEIPLLRYLSLYSKLKSMVTVTRDITASRMAEHLEHPDDFRNILSLYELKDIPESAQSRLLEASLRDRFAEFAPRWSREEADRVNDVTDCEVAIADLEQAIEAFDVSEKLDASPLHARLAFLREEFEETEGGWVDYQDDEIEGGDIPLSAPKYPQPVNAPTTDPVDDLFDTLTC